MFIIDYLIVHELTHLLEPNHTSEFRSIVRAKTPTVEKAKDWLKELNDTNKRSLSTEFTE